MGKLKLVKWQRGKYWGVVRVKATARYETIIGIKGSIPEEEARALVRDLESGRAEVVKDRFGHKYVQYKGES